MGKMNGGGWDPILGRRIFKSARDAWVSFGKYRFSCSERTFYNHVGKEKDCSPREDGRYYIEDIEFIGQSRGWPPASTFDGGFKQGGEGEGESNGDAGTRYQAEKAELAAIERQLKEIDLKKKLKEIVPVKEYEQRLAAAAAVVGNEAETFVYDNVREIIHVCGGNPEKEDSLREYLLDKVMGWLHAFSQGLEYEVELELKDDEDEFSHRNKHDASENAEM